MNNIQKENDQLRQRLAAILASRPQASASASTSHPPDIDPTLSNAVGSSGTGIDYAYLGKLQSELASAKSTLLERELELARMRGAETGDEVDVLRHLLLSHNTTLTSLQAETGTLHSMIDHLRTERDELARQGRVVTRELAGRRALRDAENGMERDVAAQGGEGRIVGVERALLDIRGWMDGAAKTWDQVSWRLPELGLMEDIGPPSSSGGREWLCGCRAIDQQPGVKSRGLALLGAKTQRRHAQA